VVPYFYLAAKTIAAGTISFFGLNISERRPRGRANYLCLQEIQCGVVRLDREAIRSYSYPRTGPGPGPPRRRAGRQGPQGQTNKLHVLAGAAMLHVRPELRPPHSGRSSPIHVQYVPWNGSQQYIRHAAESERTSKAWSILAPTNTILLPTKLRTVPNQWRRAGGGVHMPRPWPWPCYAHRD